MALELDLQLDLSGFTLNVALRTEAATLALLGPSGAGKSLTLRCVTGTIRNCRGRVVLDDIALQDDQAGIHIPPQKRGVGYVPQNYALFPHLNVAENLSFSLGRGQTRAPAVLETARLMALEDLLDRRPYQLSGGQQQRVALARALVPGPRLLVLDEPLAALDEALRRRLREDLARIQERTDTRVLVATHQVADAQALAAEVAVLDAGRVCQQGPLDQVLHHPVDRRVAELVQATNILPVQIIGSDGTWCEVRLGDATLRVLSNTPPGPAWLIVRPEQLRLLADHETTVGAEWELEGVLCDHGPRGDIQRVQVRLAEDAIVQIGLPAWWWRAHPVAPGERCRVAGCATAAHLVRDD